MGKGTFGVLTALAVWCGGALSAEAQSIGVDIVGPLSVVSTDNSMLVVANVSGTTSYNFWVIVRIGGVIKSNSYAQAGSGSQIQYTVQYLQTFPISPGTVLDINVRVKCGTVIVQDFHSVTVSAPPPPPQTYQSDPLRRAPLGIREDALAWMGRKDFEVIG